MRVSAWLWNSKFYTSDPFPLPFHISLMGIEKTLFILKYLIKFNKILQYSFRYSEGMYIFLAFVSILFSRFHESIQGLCWNNEHSLDSNKIQNWRPEPRILMETLVQADLAAWNENCKNTIYKIGHSSRSSSIQRSKTTEEVSGNVKQFWKI